MSHGQREVAVCYPLHVVDDSLHNEKKMLRPGCIDKSLVSCAVRVCVHQRSSLVRVCVREREGVIPHYRKD